MYTIILPLVHLRLNDLSYHIIYMYNCL